MHNAHRPPRGNRKLMQELNIKVVLDEVRTHGPISQADISRSTQLSSGTVTNIVKILKKRDLVREIGPDRSTGGRNPTLLSLNPEARYVMSATFFADEITVAALDLVGRIKKTVKVRPEIEKGQARVFENFARAADSLFDALHLDKKDIAGLGASFEGIIDHKRGVVILSNRFGWRNVPVRTLLKKSYGLRIFVEGDGRAMALGEYQYGAAKGASNMICVDIDSGIGAAAVLDGRICHGAHSMEGEIGHTLAVPNGAKCRCGKRGCLEAVASGSALITQIRQELGKSENLEPRDVDESLPEHMIARHIFLAAHQGDVFVLRTIRRMGYYLGLAVAGLINYSDPELVVLTGYMAYESGDVLSNIITEVAREHIVDGKTRTVRIEKGILGENAALLGAAALVYQDLFALPLVYP